MHRLLLISGLLFLLSISPASSGPIGDFNRSGHVDLKDAITAMQHRAAKSAIHALQINTGQSPALTPYEERNLMLEGVRSWFYYLGFNPTNTTIQEIENSTYDMVVMEPIFTEEYNTSFPIINIVAGYKNATHPKLVLAYLDIGQAEEWRTYWQSSWQIGNPSWIVANDPDGWEGNYPVKYWHPDWKSIWLGETGYLQKMIDAGFDGMYLDWVEAFSDENIITAASADNVNPADEMVTFIQELADYARNQNRDFLVIAQNAAELSSRNDYIAIIDAIAQEQVWFDGASDNSPPGDCPLPATESDIETVTYENLLKTIDSDLNQQNDGCFRMYEDYPDSTLHVSTQWYLDDLQTAKSKGKVIFTVDYAIIQANIESAYTQSKNLGYKPFTSERALDIYLPPCCAN